jgi:hypothetical protein
MPRSVSPFRQRTLPKVAQRLAVPEHWLRRAAAHGDVKLETWAGVDFVSPAEEERLRTLLNEVRAPIGGSRTA